MLDEILSKKILSILPESNNIQELRFREGYNLIGIIKNSYKEFNYIVSKEDIISIIKATTNNSLYSSQDTIKNGYISYKGLRIGLAGEGVVENLNLITLKNIKSLCIRVPHEYDFYHPYLEKIYNNFDNTLIISKPGLGKTTLLRSIIKKISELSYNNILLLDEKGEVSFDNTIKLGKNIDVIISIPKAHAYSSFIRVLRPNIIATDEVFGSVEIDAIQDIIRCGVKVIATMHSEGIQTINQKIYAKLLSMMRYIIVLEDVGKIKEIYDTCK